MPPSIVSIVLPTFNRAPLLRGALAALLRQTAAPSSYEVVVVDNNSTDGTAAFVASIGDPRVRCLPEPRQGLSYARNTGIAGTCGEIVAFTDDDVEAAPDWVETIRSALAAGPDVDGVGGRVLPAWPGQPPPWLTREHWAPLALQDHGDAKLVFDRARPTGLIGANVAFRRRVFERVGAFSPRFQRVRAGIGSTEDHELLTRLYDAGGRMLYLPRMLVLARVQDERLRRTYHRRWHAGHGQYHALMRTAEMERSRFRVLGVPAHVLRAALSDAMRWLRSAATGERERAFEAELRLRFAAGFIRTRLAP